MRVLLNGHAKDQLQKFTEGERHTIMGRLEAEAKTPAEGFGEGPLHPRPYRVVVGELAVATVMVTGDGLLVTGVQRRLR